MAQRRIDGFETLGAKCSVGNPVHRFLNLATQCFRSDRKNEMMEIFLRLSKWIHKQVSMTNFHLDLLVSIWL